ncbi:MAG: FAD-dependent oxidoreductase [Actinomycetota bacterium]|nr:FAD-dependent oxidoreductase [Actinomycetota bacterium]
MPVRIVVVGSGAAGIGAAAAARATDPSAEVSIYRGSQEVPGGFDRLFLAGPQTCIDAGIVLRLDRRVTGIDPDRRVVDVDGEGSIGWDRLVLTAGSPPAGPEAFSDLEGVYPLGTIPPGGEWDQVLAGAKVAVVVDATPPVLEMVTALAERGIETHVVDSHPSVLAGTADADIAAPVEESWAEMGVKIHFNTRVEGYLGEGRVRGVRTSEGELPADVVVVCTRAPAGSDLATAAGLEVSAVGGVKVDEHMATSAHGVWAAGEGVDLPGGVVWVPFQAFDSHAYAQGRVAGTNAAGGKRVYQPAYVPWSLPAGRWTLGGVAFGETQVKAEGTAYVLAKAQGISRARYYPDMKKVTVKLLAEPGSLRLIGAQMVGGEGIQERADFLGMAVKMGITLTDLAFMENVYSPPIGALNEPIAVAAQNGLATVKG